MKRERCCSLRASSVNRTSRITGPAAIKRAPSRRAALAAILAAPIAACGRGRSKGRLSLWAQDVEGENAKYLLPAFVGAGGEPVDLQWLATTAAHEKLLTAYAGGTLPDVMMLARSWVSEFATLNALAPVPAGLLEDQFAGARAAMRVGGREWGVPWTLDTQVQYHRRDLVEAAGYAAPPPRWVEWKAMLQGIKRRQRDGFALLMQLNWPEHLMNFAAAAGAMPLADRQSRGAFTSPAFVEALGFYRSLFDEGLAPLATGTDAPDPAAELARGWVAIYPAGAWTAADVRRRRLIPVARWGIAPMPSPSGAAGGIVAGAVLAVARTAADPAAAWRLVRFLTAPATEVAFHRIAGTLPSRPSAWASAALASDPAAAPFGATLLHPAPVPGIPEWPRIQTEVQAIAERMVRGDLTLAAAAAAMDARADALLAKRRWLLERGRIA
jgi:multiple sugar transport system substrate-binding protein